MKPKVAESRLRQFIASIPFCSPLATPVFGGAINSVTDLGIPAGYSWSSALAINNSGQVAGYAALANGYYHAMLFGPGGITDLGTFGGDQSWANGINDNGQVVGSCIAEVRQWT